MKLLALALFAAAIAAYLWAKLASDRPPLSNVEPPLEEQWAA